MQTACFTKRYGLQSNVCAYFDVVLRFCNCISYRCGRYPDANPCDNMLDQLFHEKNRNRSLPCVQVIFSIIILKYNL